MGLLLSEWMRTQPVLHVMLPCLTCALLQVELQTASDAICDLTLELMLEQTDHASAKVRQYPDPRLLGLAAAFHGWTRDVM